MSLFYCLPFVSCSFCFLAPPAKRDADEIVVAKRPTKQKRAPLKDLSNIGEEEPDPSDGSVESCPTSLQFAKFEYTRNRRFNSLFPKKPSLIEFVQVVENESRAYAEDLRQVRTARRELARRSNHPYDRSRILRI